MAIKKRGLFENIFGKKQSGIEQTIDYRLLNTYDSTFTAFSGKEWDIATVRSAVNTFARHAAKITPRHIRKHDGTYDNITGNYDRVLQYKPNPYMTAYAFYYKIAINYKLSNNAFIYPVWEEDKLISLYPIMAEQVKLKEHDNELYCVFKFSTGKSYFIPYSEIIHIKNHYYDNDIFGSNNNALNPVLKTAHTFNQSMSKFAELVSVIRGILKATTAAKSEDLKARRDEFIRDNMMVDSNGSGIIVSDSKYDYTPIADKSTPIPSAQLKYIKDEIYNYFGVNENIIQNKFTENEWNAFYEGEVEPFCIQLSQAMTNAFFTDKERGFGNEIVVEANKLQYASVSTKIAAGNFLTNIGAASLDQILEIFNMAPIGGEEGKRRVQTLNMVNASLADEYQSGKKIKKEEEEGDEENAD